MYPDEFSRSHPSVGFAYFALVIVFSAFCMHPLCLLISLGCSAAYVCILQGRKSLKLLGNLALLCLVAVLMNAAFNHRGATVLCYLPSDNPLTLESIVYGLAAAMMLMSVMLWCVCFSAVMGTDKLLYLFGGIVPSLSLMLSMTLRFIPRYKKQLEAVREAQDGLGQNGEDLMSRIRTAVSCFSALVTWSLESSVHVSDSMRARGYGCGKRSCYSDYIMEARDRTMLFFLSAGGILLLAGAISGSFSCSFFPKLSFAFSSACSPIFFLVYLLVFIIPVYLDEKSKVLWNTSESNT